VLLYELLTGSTPFDSRQLSSGGIDEMRRIIREVEPPCPSSRLSTLDADRLSAVAHQRRCDPQRLGRLVEGDLDWIVMRCLEKDRTRRYDTAVGLAEDIQRHLSDEPVQARPPTLAYRTRKFVRRNKIAVFATSAIATAILLGLALATMGFLQARRQSEIASKEAARSQQTAQFLKDMLKGVGPSVALGRDTTMLREIVDKTAERVDKDLKDQPEAAIDLRLTLASVYRDLQLFKKMEVTARETARIARAHFGEENLALADALGQLGVALFYLCERDEAEVVTRQSIALHRKLRGDGSLEEADALESLGHVLKHKWALTGCREDKRHFIDEAESAARAALAMRRKRLSNDSEEVARALRTLSQVLSIQDKLSEAEDAAAAAVAISQRLFGDEHPRTASCSSELGYVIAKSENRLAEAESILRKALENQIKTQGDGKLLQHNAHKDLAGVLQRQGKYDEAEIHFRAALAIARKEMGPDYPDLIVFLSYLAAFLRDRGRPAEARTPAEEAFALCQRLPDLTDPFSRQKAFLLLTEVLIELGDIAAFETVAAQFLQDSRANFPADDPWLAVSLANLANILRQNGKLAEARPLAEEAVSICRRYPGRIEGWMQERASDALRQVLTDLGDTVALDALATQLINNAELAGNADQLAAAYAGAIPLLMAGGRQTEAEDLCRKLLALTPQNGNADSTVAWFLATAENPAYREPALAVELAKEAVELNPKAGSWWNTLGAAHYRAGDWEPALEALGKSMELRQGGNSHDWFFVAMTHWKLGDRAEARRWYDQAVAWMDQNQPNNAELRRFRAEAGELIAEQSPATQP
jgi:tetratricopeptide (TPR) repeat protein